MLRVIDTSHWKGDIVTTNVDFDGIYTKATEGNYYVDDTCDPIVQYAINRGKKWGVFHFATNLITDAITEANYFVDNVQGYVGKGLLILDTEHYHWSDGTHANNAYNTDWALAWLRQVFARTGVKPLVYMSLEVRQNANWDAVIAEDYGLIVAAYLDNNTPIPNWQMDPNRDPNPSWGKVGDVMWQYTSTGHLDGYGGNLDCNFFYGDGSVWDAYAGTHADTPPPVQPAPEPTPAPVVIPPVITPLPEPVTPSPVPIPVAPADPTAAQPVPTPTPALTPTPAPVQDTLLARIIRWVLQLLSTLGNKK